MKHIKTKINEGVNLLYRAAINGVKDDTGMDMVINIELGSPSDVKAFEKWINKMEDDVFSHAQGGNIEY